MELALLAFIPIFMLFFCLNRFFDRRFFSVFFGFAAVLKERKT